MNLGRAHQVMAVHEAYRAQMEAWKVRGAKTLISLKFRY